jgi:hypothetical protein
MRSAILLLTALTAPVWGQIARPVSAGGAVPAPGTQNVRSGKPQASLASLTVIEQGFDGNLRSYNLNDPIDILGATRGIYLAGCGAIFTTEISLVVTPSLSPFRQTITEQEKNQVHQRKLARLPVLRTLMTSMVKSAAVQLNLMPDTDQVVLAVKLLYLPWENTEGLPGQILMRASRSDALAGKIQTEEQ